MLFYSLSSQQSIYIRSYFWLILTKALVPNYAQLFDTSFIPYRKLKWYSQKGIKEFF